MTTLAWILFYSIIFNVGCHLVLRVLERREAKLMRLELEAWTKELEG